MASLYHWLTADPLVTQDTLHYLQFSFSYGTLRLLSWPFALVAGLHAISLIRTLAHSVRTGELSFVEEADQIPNPEAVQCFPAAQRTYAAIERTWITPYFDLDGEHYDHMFLLIAYLQLGCQLYQCYQMSLVVGTRWINHVFVSMIVVNCVSIPVLKHLVADVPLRRLLDLGFSAFLSFIDSALVPVLIFMPYQRAFDTTEKQFYFEYIMDDVWYSKAVRENQLLFVTSYLDFLSTWMPHLGLFSCLATCESMVRRKRHRNATIVPVTFEHRDSIISHIPIMPTPKPHHRYLQLYEHVFHHLLWIIGILVLVIHIVAQSPKEIAGCRLPSTPWFATKPSCIIMTVNCYRRDIQGNHQQVIEVLSELNEKSLLQLTFAHCPKLQVPPIIRTFPHLGGIDIYNSTIDQWSAQASIRQQDNPQINYVWICRTKLAGIPDGLLDNDIPPALQTMYFFDTNLSSLPDNLDTAWKTIPELGLEFCQFDDFPPMLTNMKLVYLALTGNPLRDTTSMRLKDDIYYLYLSNSSLSALPNDTIGTNLKRLAKVELEHTQVSQVPLYLREWYMGQSDHPGDGVEHSLFGSPYCTRSLPAEDVDEILYQKLVCAKDFGTAGGWFDIATVDKQRQT